MLSAVRKTDKWRFGLAKAFAIFEFGDPESYRLVDLPVRQLKPNEVRIEIKAAGVSFIDMLVAKGGYQRKPKLPYFPGHEFSGVVAEIGSDVSNLQPGDRILASANGGAYAEEAIIPALSALKIPGQMSFEAAATFLVSYTTGYYALVQRGDIKPEETILVLGASGAVGIAAIQLGKIFGAQVIAATSSPKKADFLIRCGADHVVDIKAEGFRDSVKQMTDGRGVDIVYDPVGGDYTERAFRSLAWKGRHLVIGYAEGSIPKLPVNLSLLKGAALVGVDARQFGEYEREQAAENIAALIKLVVEGKIDPPIAKTFGLDGCKEAFDFFESGTQLGRVVLTISQ